MHHSEDNINGVVEHVSSENIHFDIVRCPLLRKVYHQIFSTNCQTY